MAVVDVSALGREHHVVHGATMVLETSLSLPDLRGEFDGKVGARGSIGYTGTQGLDRESS